MSSLGSDQNREIFVVTIPATHSDNIVIINVVVGEVLSWLSVESLSAVEVNTLDPLHGLSDSILHVEHTNTDQNGDRLI